MCPDFFPGYSSSSHRCSHNASILTYICTTQPSRTWSTGVRMFHRSPRKAATHYQYIVPNICGNPSICPSAFPQTHNANPLKGLKLSNRSEHLYSSVGHGCTLECMWQTLFISQSTTATASRVSTGGAKRGLLSPSDCRWPWRIINITAPQCAHVTPWCQWTQSLSVLHFYGSVC